MEIRGNIERGDFKKFKNLLEEIKQSNGFVIHVYLYSYGGARKGGKLASGNH